MQLRFVRKGKYGGYLALGMMHGPPSLPLLLPTTSLVSKNMLPALSSAQDVLLILKLSSYFGFMVTAI